MECSVDAIYEVGLRAKLMFGLTAEPMDFDKMRAVMIQLRKQKNHVESKNRLIAMLEDLLRDEASMIKKQKLQDKYDLKMSEELEGRLANMCNLSDLIEERGIKLGEERGIKLGEELGEKNGSRKKVHELIRKKLLRNKSLAQIADELEEDEADILPLYEQVKQELESES